MNETTATVPAGFLWHQAGIRCRVTCEECGTWNQTGVWERDKADQSLADDLVEHLHRTSDRRCSRRGFGSSKEHNKGSNELKPVQRPAVLDAYEGEWVALSDTGVVLVHGPSSRDVARQMLMRGMDGSTAVVQFVFPPSDSWRVGAG